MRPSIRQKWTTVMLAISIALSSHRLTNIEISELIGSMKRKQTELIKNPTANFCKASIAGINLMSNDY